MEQKTIITNGEPNLENLSKEEERNFYLTLLARVIEYYREKREAEEQPRKDTP